MILQEFKAFLKDDSGQTTTEYILILVVVLTLIMQFKKQFKGIIEKLFGRFETEVDSDELWN